MTQNEELAKKRNHTPSLINRKNLRDWALLVVQNERAHSYDRVSASFYREAEGVLRNWVANKVKHDLPSAGRTIK